MNYSELRKFIQDKLGIDTYASDILEYMVLEKSHMLIKNGFRPVTGIRCVTLPDSIGRAKPDAFDDDRVRSLMKFGFDVNLNPSTLKDIERRVWDAFPSARIASEEEPKHFRGEVGLILTNLSIASAIDDSSLMKAAGDLNELFLEQLIKLEEQVLLYKIDPEDKALNELIDKLVLKIQAKKNDPTVKIYPHHIASNFFVSDVEEAEEPSSSINYSELQKFIQDKLGIGIYASDVLEYIVLEKSGALVKNHAPGMGCMTLPNSTGCAKFNDNEVRSLMIFGFDENLNPLLQSRLMEIGNKIWDTFPSACMAAEKEPKYFKNGIGIILTNLSISQAIENSSLIKAAGDLNKLFLEDLIKLEEKVLLYKIEPENKVLNELVDKLALKIQAKKNDPTVKRYSGSILVSNAEAKESRAEEPSSFIKYSELQKFIQDKLGIDTYASDILEYMVLEKSHMLIKGGFRPVTGIRCVTLPDSIGRADPYEFDDDKVRSLMKFGFDVNLNPSTLKDIERRVWDAFPSASIASEEEPKHFRGEVGLILTNLSIASAIDDSSLMKAAGDLNELFLEELIKLEEQVLLYKIDPEDKPLNELVDKLVLKIQAKKNDPTVKRYSGSIALNFLVSNAEAKESHKRPRAEVPPADSQEANHNKRHRAEGPSGF